MSSCKILYINPGVGVGGGGVIEPTVLSLVGLERVKQFDWLSSPTTHSHLTTFLSTHMVCMCMYVVGQFGPVLLSMAVGEFV